MKKLGILSASFMGISAIIGSGWLFSPLLAANIAGPAAIFSWIIGALIILVLGLCFSEIASIYPLRGLSAVITSISHNRFFGFPFAIANWLGIVAVIALEADAAVQYLINIFPNLNSLLFNNGAFTFYGNLICSFLVLLFSVINFWGVSILAKTNNVITLIKLFVPIITIVVVGYSVFPKENFTAINDSLIPYGYSSIIQTILVAGIIVSFNGFQTIISFASEIKNPNKTIPISIAISVISCLIIYVLIQIVFIGALPLDVVNKGWKTISMSAPVINLLSMIGLSFMSIIIYAGATITPIGTAINFTGASSRMFTAMAKERQVPVFFDSVHPKYNISRRSLIFNTFVALCFIFIFKSWGDLAQILGIFHIFSYLTVPVAMLVFRENRSAKDYGFYMPFGLVICYSLFIIFNILIGYSNLRLILYSSLIIIFFELSFICINLKSSMYEIKKNSLSIAILLIYIVLLPSLSYMNKHLSASDFLIFTFIFSIVFLKILTKFK